MKHKDYYDDQYILDIAQKIHAVQPSFDKTGFSNELLGQLDELELFARFDCIVDAMQKYLSDDYSNNIQAFYGLLGPELNRSEGMFTFGWWLWPIGRYVERYGTADWQVSLAFLKELTKRFTGEYAIRPLLKEQPEAVMDELIVWTRDENVHVRRLASEGVRIRLPWSAKLMVALDEFDRYKQILTNLKDDSEKFVQKSVGNNLNDLYKEAPDKADAIITSWQDSSNSKAQAWIIKHGMRKQK
ncbi:DNA alkylation repair protein [Culicoidibacter larvae]|uniref:DNA alkylation repair protein n=1 Tax=Culicoidibacter larvae TaxID=2579976 RepID=A0A5R8QBC1_9FIRM|nr:DNA alkylation repair protein [Culicoidibacter larvae]TLG72925.1 DNA alkylation repair protein [Culicoidibacter larvae]